MKVGITINEDKNYSSLPSAVTASIAAQDLRMTSAHSLDSLAKSAVTNCPNFSHGVRPVNCSIGAEAAIALEMVFVLLYFCKIAYTDIKKQNYDIDHPHHVSENLKQYVEFNFQQTHKLSVQYCQNHTPALYEDILYGTMLPTFPRMTLQTQSQDCSLLL